MKRVIIVVVEEPATTTELKSLAALATNVITNVGSSVLATTKLYNTPTYKSMNGHVSMFANTDNLTLMSRIVTYIVSMLSRQS